MSPYKYCTIDIIFVIIIIILYDILSVFGKIEYKFYTFEELLYSVRETLLQN